MYRYHTDEELISELHRFVRENSKIPYQSEMTIKNGYPSAGAYVRHFGSWNEALIAAGFEINQIRHKLDGTETCSHCGCYIEEAGRWCYDEDGNRYCYKHGQKGLRDYVKGTLDINSSVGRGRSGELLVAKVLGIGKEHDCNRISCGYEIDLYHEEYGKIDVKTSVLSDDYRSRWNFGFHAKKVADTYICIGLSYNGKNVYYVWIIPNEGEIRDLKGLEIKNTEPSLDKYTHWQVNAKPYMDMWKTMDLGICKTMTNKNK